MTETERYRQTLEMCLKALRGAYILPRPWLKYANAKTTFIRWETAVAAIDQAIRETEDVLGVQDDALRSGRAT